MPKKTANLHPVGVPNQAFAQWGMDLVHGSIIRCHAMSVISDGLMTVSDKMDRGLYYT